MAINATLISDSLRWRDFISSTAAGLQVNLTVICPDGTEVEPSKNCPVCEHFHPSLSEVERQEIYAQLKNGLSKVSTQDGTPVVGLQLKWNAVLIVYGCPICTQGEEQIINKALICQKLLNSFQGSLYEEIKGGQRAVELSTLRQINSIILSQFNGNQNALQHSFDLILSALVILLDAQGSWLTFEQDIFLKPFVKGDQDLVNSFIEQQKGNGITVPLNMGHIKGSLGVIEVSDPEQARILLPVMADECSIVLQIDHLFQLANKQLSRIFGSVDSAVLITDNMGIISYANPRFERLSGYRMFELIGQDAAGFAAPWTNFLKNKQINGLEGTMDTMLDMKGQKKYVNWQMSPLVEDEEKFGWLIIINDRTDHYKWQQAVDQAERLATTTFLAGSLAHEIRNPLGAVRGLLQLMGRKRESDTIKGYADLSLKELDRVISLVNEFLLLGKPAELLDDPINLDTFLEDLMPLFESEGTLYGAKIHLVIKASPLVRADFNQLKNALMNLVINAIEAGQNDGRVVITLFTENDYAVITVKDNGPGIEPRLKDKIFRPFFTTKERGKGLGLAITQAVVLNHGGKITFDNDSEDGGAVFRVSLPLNKNIDIIISIKDRFIRFPVIQSLQAAGYRVLFCQEDELLDAIHKYIPPICLLEETDGHNNLAEKVKQENQNTKIVILGDGEGEPINYSRLLNKINQCKKGKG